MTALQTAFVLIKIISKFLLELRSTKDHFYPFSVHLWNQLPLTTRASPSVSSFKKESFYYRLPTHLHFSHGPRYPTIHLTSLRLDFGQLNFHLFQHKCVNSPMCKCGHPNESTIHYLLHCPLYNNARLGTMSSLTTMFMQSILPFDPRHTTENILCSTLLKGNPVLSTIQNCHLFDVVFEFIQQTDRFNL